MRPAHFTCVAIPAVFTVYCLLGVAVSIMHLFHYRLKATTLMNKTPKSERVLRNVQRFVYLVYVLLVFTCLSFLGLLTIQNLQPTIKPVVFDKYQMPVVWCPRYIVADPFSWQVLLAISTTIFFILCVTSIVLVSGVFTLAILFNARKDLSQHTLKIQKNFTTVLIVQAIVHVLFILAPIFCIIIAVYYGIWVTDGGLFFFFVETHQGTASTLVFILTHSTTKNGFKCVEQHVRKLFGLTCSENVRIVPKM